MTVRPYTDDDLRAEAARQHALSVEDPDFMGIGERMQGSEIESLLPPEQADGAEGMHWDDLPRDDFDAAQRSIDDLLTSAADLSEWAVNLGADGLVPSTEHEITLNAGRPIARIHFAFEPDMPEDMRTNLVEGIGEALNEAGIEDEDDEEPADVGDSDSDVFDLIADIASRLRDATDSGEYHAVGLIYDLAMSRTTVAEARTELTGIEFNHV